MSKNPTKVLFVDDERAILDGLRRTLTQHYDVRTALGGTEAMEVLRKDGPFAVVVTDMQMPGMTGLEFLEKARFYARDTVYMMLTGNADQQTAVDAVNRGQIFRFMNKPCGSDELRQALDAGIRQYELVTAERVLLRDTMCGSIKVLSEGLALWDPALGKALSEVRRDVDLFAHAIGAPSDWRITLAASFGLLGMMAVRSDDMAASFTEESLGKSAECGARLLKHIPRMEPIARIVQRQRETGRWPMAIEPNDPAIMEQLATRLLRLAVDLQRARRGFVEPELAFRQARECGAPYAAALAHAAEQAFYSPGASGEGRRLVREELPMRALRASMTLEEDLLSTRGSLLLAKGTELSDIMIERIKHLTATTQIPDKVKVFWFASDGAGGRAERAA